jgi:hypothetical protein
MVGHGVVSISWLKPTAFQAVGFQQVSPLCFGGAGKERWWGRFDFLFDEAESESARGLLREWPGTVGGLGVSRPSGGCERVTGPKPTFRSRSAGGRRFDGLTIRPSGFLLGGRRSVSRSETPNLTVGERVRARVYALLEIVSDCPPFGNAWRRSRLYRSALKRLLRKRLL